MSEHQQFSPADVAQCSNCGHAKMFHGLHGCVPLLTKESVSCECKEFDNRFIRVIGTALRFRSIRDAQEAGVL